MRQARATDMLSRMRGDVTAVRERMRQDAAAMAKGRRKVGPRVRKRIREMLLDMPAEQGAGALLKLQEAAGHRDGERATCPACRFIEGN